MTNVNHFHQMSNSSIIIANYRKSLFAIKSQPRLKLNIEILENKLIVALNKEIRVRVILYLNCYFRDMIAAESNQFRACQI